MCNSPKTNFSIFVSEAAGGRSANCPVRVARPLDHRRKFRRPDCSQVSPSRLVRGATQTGQFALRLLALIALVSLMACREASQLKRAEAVEPSGAGFPRTLLDGGGSEVAIRARPVRIVSQTLGTDEILWAICRRERIVGVSKIG